ncbi:MAG: DNA repair protein RecO [Patescibacteria group bacterium]|nr:DNA repair protein RecO [Patescibacteria group bacterium]
MQYNTIGVILRKKDFRESDIFFSIYTKDTGKVQAIARGVKKVKSKLGGHLDYFATVDLMIAKGKKFDHIAGAVIEKNFYCLKSDLNKINFGFYCLEIVDYFVKEGKKDNRIFFLIKDFLNLLNSRFCYSEIKAEKENLFMVSYFFILKFLDYLGYKPEFYYCLKCHKEANFGRANFFSAQAGGIICYDCVKSSKIADCKEISNNSIKLLSAVLTNDLSEIVKIKIDRKILSECIKIIDKFLLYRLDASIKSRKFITT